jgi:kynurenine formamidase
MLDFRVVDLTQPLGPATVLWPGSTPFTAVVDGEHAREGSYYQTLTLSEHSGTHLDAPSHFSPEGRMAHELSADDLVRPAVALDVRDRCAGDPAYALSRSEVEEAEARDGAIRPGSAVVVCTGWDAHVGDPVRYAGEGDTPAFPGIAPDAAELLVERGVAGIGIDTLGVDPGHAVDFPVHRITQRAGVWHLEGAVHLHLVPARGAWLVVGAIPVVEGSGCPVRAFALVSSGLASSSHTWA